MIRVFIFIGLVALVVAGVFSALGWQGGKSAAPPRPASLEDITFTKPQTVVMTSTTPSSLPAGSPHPFIIDPKQRYAAVLHTTLGDITVELFASSAPITANNFITLAKNGFYNNTIFHRVVKGFMIQGGDPDGNGTGGPGYTFPDEPFTGEYTRGTMAMANAGPDTNGSQFFIMQNAVSLPKNYVIFGAVLKGMEVVDAIANAQVGMQPGGGERSRPLTPVTVAGVDVALLK